MHVFSILLLSDFFDSKDKSVANISTIIRFKTSHNSKVSITPFLADLMKHFIDSHSLSNCKKFRVLDNKMFMQSTIHRYKCLFFLSTLILCIRI